MCNGTGMQEPLAYLLGTNIVVYDTQLASVQKRPIDEDCCKSDRGD